MYVKKIVGVLVTVVAISFLPSCDKTYTVVWKNYDGTVLETDRNIKSGTIPSYDADTPVKPKDAQYTYTFSNWDDDITQPIKSDKVFTAQYNSDINEYTITWKNYDGTVLEIDEQVPYGTTPSYDKDDPSKPEDDEGRYSFNGWDDDITMPIVGDTTFIAQYKTIHRYTVSTGTSDHLFFSTTSGGSLSEITVFEGEPFAFKVSASSPSAYETYLVPSTLSISINGSAPLESGYKVESPGATESIVTIDADKVVGNIVISGDATIQGTYRYELSSYYGLKPIDPGVNDDGENLTLLLEPDQNYEVPQAENVYFQIDNGDWISPADKESSKYCSYTIKEVPTACGVLTIYGNCIEDDVDVKARAHDYPLLDTLSWDAISEQSFIGAAPYIFYLGEEKKVFFGDLEHRVRIIDFNHDYTDKKNPDTSKVGITFEFVDVLTTRASSGPTAICKVWKESTDTSRYNCDSRASTLNVYLNGINGDTSNSAFELLPPALKRVIKRVEKKVGVAKNIYSEYSSKYFSDKKNVLAPLLFPLSVEELGYYLENVCPGEGTVYKYYEVHQEDCSFRKKLVVGTERYAVYHTRSPQINYNLGAFGIAKNGYIEHNQLIDGKEYVFAIAPGFCV